MTGNVGTLPIELGFLPVSEAIADVDHPGLLRAGPRAGAPYGDDGIELHVCRATDCAQDATVRPDLLTFGFDTVDLSDFDTLQAAFARVLVRGRIEDTDAAIIRSELDGATLRLSCGRTVEVLYLADEGFFMRKSGPNRMPVVAPASTGMNDHGAATSIHADQDVYGQPLAKTMDGRAPSLFRHDSPDGHNHDGGLMLVNLWIPLQQITQPLVLADGRSIDRRRHQLRYGLGTETFLAREDDDLVINDIWTFLHGDDQRWYLRSDMDCHSAYLFNTLSTPHGSCTLPGEEIAEQCYRSLEALEAAANSGDVAAVTAKAVEVQPVPADVPPSLRRAIGAMVAIIDEAKRDPAGICTAGAPDWLARSRAARMRVVRMSLELRAVVSVAP